MSGLATQTRGYRNGTILCARECVCQQDGDEQSRPTNVTSPPVVSHRVSFVKVLHRGSVVGTVHAPARYRADGFSSNRAYHVKEHQKLSQR